MGSTRRPTFATVILILLDFVLRQLPSDLGALIDNNSHICYVAFADDILFLARDARSLQLLLLNLTVCW